MVLENLVVCHRESNHSHLVTPPLPPPLPFLTLSLSLTPLSPVLSPAPVHYFPFFFVRGGLVWWCLCLCVCVSLCVCCCSLCTVVSVPVYPCVWCVRVCVSVCVCYYSVCVSVSMSCILVCVSCVCMCVVESVSVSMYQCPCLRLFSPDMATREGSRR